MLWEQWWKRVCELRSAPARTRTFLWMAVCLAGMTTRRDLMGVTSIVRALGLVPTCYDRLLDFFHSPGLDLDKLTGVWRDLVFRVHPGILRVHGRPVLVGDGIKVAKAGQTPKLIWRSFGSWMRTIRPGRAPSEQVAAIAMWNTLPEFLAGFAKTSILVKFLRDRIDLSRTEGNRLAA